VGLREKWLYFSYTWVIDWLSPQAYNVSVIMASCER